MLNVRPIGVSWLVLLAVIGCSSGDPEPSAASSAAQPPSADSSSAASTPPSQGHSPAPDPAPGPAPAEAGKADADRPTSITPESVNRPALVPAWVGQPGEPFDVRQFLESRQPPADNAAPLYLLPMAQISGELPHLFPDGERDQQLQAARSLSKSISDLTKAITDQPESVQPQVVEQVLQSASSIVAQVDQAQSKPSCVFISGLGVDVALPHIQAARNLARLFIVQTFMAKVRGDRELAIAAARRSLRLSRDLRPRGPVVNHLVSIAIDSLTLDAIARYTLNANVLSPELCDQLLALLVEHQQQGLDCDRESLQVEYISLRQMLEDMRSGRLSVEEVRVLLGIPADQRLSPETIKYQAEIAAANRIFAAALRDASRPFHEVAQSGEYQAEFAKQMSAMKAGSAEASPVVLLFVQGLNAIRDASTRSQAHLAATQALTTIRRFELAHRYLPETLLEAAAETVLKTAPVDAYSGQPLRYSVIDARPTVYSVGKDLKDDGGRVDWKFGQQPGDYLFVMSPLVGTGQRPNTAPKVAESSAPATPPKPAPRSWTSSSGTKVTAEFVKLENNIAFLKKDDGRILQVPLDKLSEADARWIRENASPK